jgi:hypothetical protein
MAPVTLLVLPSRPQRAQLAHPVLICAPEINSCAQHRYQSVLKSSHGTDAQSIYSIAPRDLVLASLRYRIAHLHQDRKLIIHSLFCSRSKFLFSFLRYSCPNPALPTWCGDLRDSQSKLILDANGNAQSKCVALSSSSSCPSIPNFAAKAVPLVQSISGNVPVSLNAVARGNQNTTVLATLNIPANTVSGVAFVISPVADSVYQAGSFAALFSSGKLRSPLISISPSSIVDTRSGTITLALPVDVPSSQCNVAALSNMRVRGFICVARSAPFG